jgi:hypothetical protein
MKTVKVDNIPNIKKNKNCLSLGDIFKDQERSHRLANKYFVLSLQSEPSNPKGILNLILMATRIKTLIIHILNTHITQLSRKTSNQQWPKREQT